MPPQHRVDFQCDCDHSGAVGDSTPVLWPDGLVPFEIDGSVADPALSLRAMDIWMFRQNAPNVTFIRRDPANPAHANYMRIVGVAGPVSSSPLGMSQGAGIVQQGSIVNDYVMAHEYAHTLGFPHEHSRPDRDAFVTVHYSRVFPASMQPNFFIFNHWPANSWNTPYDYDSVMHYHATTFMNPACDGGFASCISVLTCTPLVAINPLYQCLMGQQSFLSQNDVADMRNVYGPRGRALAYVGPNPGPGTGFISNPYPTPESAGVGGDVYIQGGTTYLVPAGTRFETPGVWKKHSAGLARISAP
jgi:hypothetical protein